MDGSLTGACDPRCFAQQEGRTLPNTQAAEWFEWRKCPVHKCQLDYREKEGPIPFCQQGATPCSPQTGSQMDKRILHQWRVEFKKCQFTKPFS